MDRITRAPQINPQLSSAGGGLLGLLMERAFSGIAGALTSLVGGFAGALGDIFGWKRQTENNLADVTQNVYSHDTELAGLQSKTQKLEGVIGYGHSYSEGLTSWSVFTLFKVPMDRQVGPIEGVAVQNGSLRLDTKGLWRASAQVQWSAWNIPYAGELQLEIRVYTPDWGLHSRKNVTFDGVEPMTLITDLAFTVPESGYFVELWTKGALGRTLLSGSATNHLYVSKVSTETQ